MLVLMIIFQNHLSATFLICATAIILMFMSGCKISHLVLIGILAIGAVLFYLLETGGFRFERILSFLNPWADTADTGWQIVQSLYAIGSGGLFGAGLGASKQKYLYLPEPHNDFIFAVLAEELGFIGCIVVIILFLIFIWRGIIIALKAQDTFGTLIAVGIVSLIGIQAIINIAVVTNTIPVTGMQLPFFSYGGTAMIFNLAAVGILLNIARSSKKK